MHEYAVDIQVRSILDASSEFKQRLGRRFAYVLGLEPGPLGTDDGVDGVGYQAGRKVYFQCRLRRIRLGKDDARALYSDMDKHRADLGVVLAGVGYTDGFWERLENQTVKYVVHRLTLRDIFLETLAFQETVHNLPPLRHLGTEARNLLGE
ncbi:MAG: restriction endonuclease [Deltaproteobacteria bacterium]|nr:restriction endonuclease [Deltaproteobacteria bacterium]